jgi:hypothetical protein
MRKTPYCHIAWLTALAILFAAATSSATVVASGNTPFVEPLYAAYSGVKYFTVYTDDDVDNPMPGMPGELTYVFTIKNDLGSYLALLGFNIEAPVGSVLAAGSIDDGDLLTPPPAFVTNINDGVVRWDWTGANLIDPGDTTDELFIVSAYTPGEVNANIFSIEGDYAYDVTDYSLGPKNPPTPCELDVIKEACVIQPPPVPGDGCDGKLVSFTFEYTGLGCDATSHLQDPKKVLCVGGAGGGEPVNIIVEGKKHKKGSKGKKGSKTKASKKKGSKTSQVFGSFTDVSVGDSITVLASTGGKNTFGSETNIKIQLSDGTNDELELDRFHTSCSQPIDVGNQFGSIALTALTSTEGGVVTLPEDPPSEACVTSIDVTPPPHCDGKVQTLSLRYTGGDCSLTMNSQTADKTGCTDTAAIASFPIRLIVSNDNVSFDQSPILIGDVLDITAAGEFKPNTSFEIRDAGSDALLESGFFHTSCSQPLDLGDQFGALQVFGLNTTGGGSVSLESEVLYTYDVSHLEVSGTATNVNVVDDVLGVIATDQTILAGETLTFTTTAYVSEETTNSVTVTGEMDGSICEPGMAEATISVAAPPPPSTTCTTKVSAMLLRYTGSDTLGARVEIEAKEFPAEVVVYDPIDLVSGATELTLPAENGFSIDAQAHDATDLGSQVLIRINGVEENIHTSCSTPFAAGEPAPLTTPVKGDPSPNWFVVDFKEK